MKKPVEYILLQLFIVWILPFPINAQFKNQDSSNYTIAFVSDTQAPLGIEKIYLKANKNTLATKMIFQDLVNHKPEQVFILGDVVAIGSKERKWNEMDHYLKELRNGSTTVTAILGNHDVMMNANKGEATFKKRFPDEINTGFYKITDSIGIVLLNSNFKKLSSQELSNQSNFYAKTLSMMDADAAVKMVIVACHHAPYSNSKIVGSNLKVQAYLLPAFFQSKKAKLFITGHAHDFEHFNIEGKDFLTIGGGGGLHQPLRTKEERIAVLSDGYEPEFHYLTVHRNNNELFIASRYLTSDFKDFKNGYHFIIK